MGKLIIKLVIISIGICILSIILIRFLYSNSSDVEYKMMEKEPGRSFYKFIGIVPESYKKQFSKQFSIIINQKKENFTLFEIIRVDSFYDDYSYFYIRFKNKKGGFLKGEIGDPRNGNGNYLCSAINIQLFNEYINSKGIINEDSIRTEYVNLLKNKTSNYQSFARIESVKQMRYFLHGIPLWKRGANDAKDTIDIENLKISYDKELVYWIQHRGFLNFKFSFIDDHKVNSIDCEDIGMLDTRLLGL